MAKTTSSENLKIIFGIKIKTFRTEQGLSLQTLSRKSGIALSYLSEIESGKKYPKPEKLIDLAQALGVDYDELVSLKVDKSLDPFTALIDSELIKQFPFHLFGISARDILGLFKNDPENAHSFLQTFLQISRAYDMSVETFLFAALRTFQRLHNNYFPDLEKLAGDFSKQNELSSNTSSFAQIKKILEEKHKYHVEENGFSDHPALKGFRSILRGERHLSINSRLLPAQKAFIIARELGFLELGITDRPQTSSWIEVKSFDQLVNNFKASYFAGALLIEKESFTRDVKKLLSKSTWDDKAITALLDCYKATPEMLLYRMSQLLPGVFGLDAIFYLRFTNSKDRFSVKLTKELNMTDTLVPYGLGISEHYCRRWLPLRLLKKVRQDGLSITTGVQKIHFVNSGTKFLLLSLARPLSLARERGSAIVIGFKIDKNSRKHIKFLDDPAIVEEDVGETCERCPLTDCSERVVEASIISRQDRSTRRESALQQFLDRNC
ncbi:helix-turn-helix transcriptional regulator [Desulfopila inferna]|uniref:helix-turn-helix transcriptional regulator n=1 Tax=Desulfopila inferna TaxID=468528 RepID=UPI0019650B29|nr:helix-turn-helix transcriptional regulator [Desulfopila inferna]MBM9606589.1 helix-turn-helix domain-containing protein [Desulfopila inferna]